MGPAGSAADSVRALANEVDECADGYERGIPLCKAEALAAGKAAGKAGHSGRRGAAEIDVQPPGRLALVVGHQVAISGHT